jgi:hypothetical protein
LIEWWNGIESRFLEMQREEMEKQRDRDASIKERHNYGRDGEVFPEVEGGAKRRRRRK